jgi:hypothetical protein
VDVKCAVCGKHDAPSGVLCEVCSDALDGSSPIWPEQIELRGPGALPAALIDPWGQPHHLDPQIAVGRSIEPMKLVVLDPSVSRRHAELSLADNTWTVRDLGSFVGTFINDQKLEQPSVVRHGDRIRFGDIAMYFVDTAPRLEQRFDIATYRLPKGQMPGLPEVSISLQVPSGGGGAFGVIDGKRLQLTTPQYELLELLADRMRKEAGKPDGGFVALSELGRLSLDVADPGEQHVRQLVYRVRRLLLNAGVGDLIEVRRGVGYRLRVVPRG